MGSLGSRAISFRAFSMPKKVLLCIGTELNPKGKIFCVLAYIPKATVQAAIGAIPLSMGVESGDLILSLAVLAIIITAPLGAIAIKATGPRLL